MSLPRTRLETATRTAEGRWLLDEDALHHLVTVRRLGEGAGFEGLLPGWRVGLRLCREEGRWIAEETGRVPERGLPLRIVLFAALLKGEAFDLLLRQVTEVGVARIVPLLCERSIPRLEGRVAQKEARWQRILEEATKQCGASAPPELGEPRGVEALGASEALPEDRFAALLDGNARPLADVPFGDEVAFAVGPEGDFTAREKDMLRERAFSPVTLGGRVLRAPTAATVGCALLMMRREAEVHAAIS